MFLWLILAVAAALRLWRLETPSLWFDEVLVAMVAKLPSASIVARSLAEDFHPPTFYLLTKFFMMTGSSDAALRLPLVAFGLGGVWYAWKVGREMLSEGGGLIIAALVAVQPWHLLLSRQVRPYNIVFLFSLAAFFHLWRAIRDGRTRDFLLAGLCLWPTVALHFSGLLVMGGAGLVALCAVVSRRSKPGQTWIFFVVCAVAGVSILPFLSSLFLRESGIMGSNGFAGVLGEMVDRMNALLFRELHPRLRVVIACASLFGLGSLLLKRNRLLGLVSLGWALFPLTALVAARYSSYFNPWHLIFLLPPILLCQAQAIRELAGERALPWLAVLLCLLGCWWYFGITEEYYYRPGSYSGQYKQSADRLLAAHSPGTISVYPESAVTGPLNWYLDQFASPNPLRAQRLGPQDAVARLVVPASPKPPRLLARQPVQAIAALPFRTHVTCAPDEFLSQVHGLEDVACQPVLENILIATTPRRTGWAEFVFENDSDSAQFLALHFGYSNRKPGNRFAAMFRFDDEPWAATFESCGPDIRGHDKLEIRRDKPYHTLTVRFELQRDGRSPAFTGEDLEAVRFLDFKLEINSEKTL